MSWLFSRALVAASSAGTCSDGEPSAPSSTTPTPQAYLWRDKTTDAWRRFPSGMTCGHLTESRGEELLTSFLAGFPVRTSAPPERASELTASEAASGAKWHGSLAKYDRVSHSWRTAQCLLFEDSAECLEIWPKWGTTRDGAAYRQQTPSSLLEIRQRITAASEFGSRLPTPRSQEPGRTSEGYGRGLAELIEGNQQIAKWPTPRTQMTRPCLERLDAPKRHKSNLEEVVAIRDPATAGGKLNPQWVEWLMGWPIGWTDLSALEMDKFQRWRRSHGDC